MIMRCRIDGITHQGEGVARIDGKAVFVPFAIPGEEVQIEIIKEMKRFSRACIKEIITSSPDRVAPPCQYFYKCGGCTFQHVTYERHLQIKKQVVSEALKRIGKQEVIINDVIGMEVPWFYRNKVTWHIGKTKGEKRLGYYQFGSRRHLPISDCLIIAPEIKKLSRFLDCYLEVTGINSGQQVVIRQDSQEKLYLFVEGPVDKEGLTSLVKGYPGLESLFIYNNGRISHVFGSKKLDFIIGQKHYQVSPLAFFQINNQQTEVLYDAVKKTVGNQPGKRILDAYCGTGSIAIYASSESDTVLGVDAFSPGIQDASINAAHNNRNNYEFVTGLCEEVLPDIKQDFDIAILDPPRAGCHPDLIASIIKKNIPRIIYVSCDPATLARDIRILSEAGYIIESVQPIDMFPWTAHVETVVLMSRVEK